MAAREGLGGHTSELCLLQDNVLVARKGLAAKEGYSSYLRNWDAHDGQLDSRAGIRGDQVSWSDGVIARRLEYQKIWVRLPHIHISVNVKEYTLS